MAQTTPYEDVALVMLVSKVSLTRLRSDDSLMKCFSHLLPVNDFII